VIDVVVSVVAAGAVGSLHCTSMCGGLVAFGTAGTTQSLRDRAGALASYNATRGLGYVVLGAIAGALGSSLDHAGLRIGMSRAAGMVASVVMISWGVWRLLEAFGVGRRATPASIHVPLGRLVRRLGERPPPVRSAVVGACTALLPCGFLHAFLVVAAGTGSMLRGALVMGAFWLGTLPAVLGFGIGVNTLLAPLRRHVSVVGAMLLVVFGLSNLLQRWSPFAPAARDGSTLHAR
jgi:sulfite exporter TauE/SafE